MTLFTCTSTEGWSAILQNALNSQGIDQGPKTYARPQVGIFFVIYMIIVGSFMTNVFVGYVIVTFQDRIDEEYKDCPFDKTQRKCIRFCLKAKPRDLRLRKNPTPLQKKCLELVSSRPFEYFIMGTIVLNLIVLMMKFEGMSKDYEYALTIINAILTSIFGLEAILKMFGMGLRGYFTDGWNIFDIIVVAGSFVDIGLDGQSVNVSFLRIFRAARLVKLMKKGEIKRLLFTFVRSLKALPWVGLMILMVFFVYAIVGMQVFGRLQLNTDLPINSHNNFQTFPMVRCLYF